MPRLKVCGVTRPEFASEAVRRGVDYIGMIFVDGSPRRVDMNAALNIVSAEKGAKVVGVFANASVDEIVSTARRVPLNVVQLHGAYGGEAVAALKQLGFEVWRLDDGGASAGEDATLVDGSDGRRRGGTGKLADWSRVATLKREGRCVVLAGGLSADNIAEAAATGADVLDVNSSLEIAPGEKSIVKLDELLAVLLRQTTNNTTTH